MDALKLLPTPFFPVLQMKALKILLSIACFIFVRNNLKIVSSTQKPENKGTLRNTVFVIL